MVLQIDLIGKEKNQSLPLPMHSAQIIMLHHNFCCKLLLLDCQSIQFIADDANEDNEMSRQCGFLQLARNVQIYKHYRQHFTRNSRYESGTTRYRSD
jgi:hypothetical protein